MTNPQQYDDLTVDDITTALSYLDPYMPRREWVRVGMAVKSELGQAGFAVWDEWSKGAGKKYNAADARDTWKSIKPGGGVNIGTLIYQAMAAGFRFTADRPRLSQDEIEARRKKREAEEREAAAERRRVQGEAAKLANLVWNDAQPADDSHPYLVAKNVHAHGLRIGEWPLINDAGEVFKRIPGALLIPIMDAKGRITSLQGIVGTEKRYLKNGRKRGGFYIIGSPKPGTPVVLCEGYATGATIHRLTGWCVVVAFDEGNLASVGTALPDCFPGSEIIVAADNDQWTTRQDGTPYNPGVEAARDIGAELNARVIVPQFADVSTQPTDFNDLAALEGDDVAQGQLMAHLAKLPAPANDNQPTAVDVFTPLPDEGGKGKKLSTIENLAEVCRRLGVTVRYNVISKEEELLIPGHGFSVDNAANASLAWLKSWCSRFRMPVGDLGDFVTYLADQNLYNPVAQWITSKPWDGVPRLQALYDTVTPANDVKLRDGRRLRDVLIMRWMVSAVAGAFQPNGVSAHGILVLQGDQYLGKTHWFKKLVPAELGVLKDGMILRPDDKDSVKQACSFWLVELGELDATFRKSDIAQLKSFITNQSDVLRRAYARKESHFARRTVFFGSVNPREYLHDPTGNRRYWTIEAKALNVDHGLDMQQVWAEVYELFKQGESYYLQPEEMAALNSHNEAFTVVDPIEERLQTRLDWQADTSRWEWKTSTEVLISVGVDKPTQADATKAAHYIRKANGGQGKRSAGKSLLLVPPKPLSREDYERPF